MREERFDPLEALLKPVEPGIGTGEGEVGSSPLSHHSVLDEVRRRPEEPREPADDGRVDVAVAGEPALHLPFGPADLQRDLRVRDASRLLLEFAQPLGLSGELFFLPRHLLKERKSGS